MKEFEEAIWFQRSLQSSLLMFDVVVDPYDYEYCIRVP